VLDDVELGGIDVDGVGPGARGGYSSARSQHLDIDSARLVCPNHMLAHRDCGTFDGSRSALHIRNDPDSSPTILSSGDSPR